MAPTNPAPVIDFGSHFHTPNRPHSDDGLGALLRPLDRDPQRYLDWFVDGGIDAVVLSQPFLLGHHDAETAAEGNDALLEIVERFDAFYGLAAIPVAAGGSVAAAEFERCLDAGYHGGALTTNAEGIELTDDRIEPVLEVADSTGAPLLVHQATGGPDRAVLGNEYQLNFSVGREAATAKSLIKVIHTGVLDRYPGLNLVYHHYAGNLPSMLGRIHLHLEDGRWPDREGKDYEEFKAQLEDRVYLDTSGYYAYRAPLRTALEELPASQLVLATDAPFEPRTATELREYVDGVRETASRGDARRILGENALDLLVNV